MTPDEIMKDAEPVPFIAYEAVQIRGDVREKRLCSINKLLGFLLSILFIASCVIIYLVHRSCMDKIEKNNQRWISYLEQYDFASYEYSQDGEGLNILGDRNGVNYYGPEVDGENQDAARPTAGAATPEADGTLRVTQWAASPALAKA